MSETATVAQYLTFSLGAEVFAFDVAKVREVLELIPITKVPRAPEYMSGVVNVRGSVVPVIDLRLKLGMGTAERTVNTCIIVIEVPLDGGMTVLGVLVDSVQEVVEFEGSQIAPAPRIGTGVKIEFLSGIGRREDRFVLIMDIARVLSDEDFQMLADAEGAGTAAETAKAP